MDREKQYPSSEIHTLEHQKEHHYWSRRGFLKTLGLAGGSSILMGGHLVSTFHQSLFGFGLSQSSSDRILLMVRLKGGNDGLNTIIPTYDYGRYQNLRPNIRIPNNQVIPLTPELGMHPALSGFKHAWNEGHLKVINNVGYPDQNLSHFRSSDIWASSSDSDVVWDTGFLGRFFDGQYPDFLLNPPAIPPAVQIGGLGNLAFVGEDNVNYAVTVATPELLELIVQSGGLYDVENIPDCFYGSQVAYLRTIANNTFKYAKIISDAYKSGENKVNYTGDFGQQLAITSKLIKGNLGTKLYMVTLDGFDTHAGQLNTHQTLLSLLNDNLTAFFEDLRIDGYDQRVLAFTFSEFGRRIQQNSSVGTDHGAAAPMFVVGPALRGNGSLGGLPDLVNLDRDGNLRHQIDFRSLYATLMEYWLCMDSNVVDLALGHNFDRLNLGIDCLPTSSIFSEQSYLASQLQHEIRYAPDGQPWLYLRVPRRGFIDWTIFTPTGQPLKSFPGQFFENGEESLPIQRSWFSIPGYYMYKLKYENKIYSGKVLIKK